MAMMPDWPNATSPLISTVTEGIRCIENPSAGGYETKLDFGFATPHLVNGFSPVAEIMAPA